MRAQNDAVFKLVDSIYRVRRELDELRKASQPATTAPRKPGAPPPKKPAPKKSGESLEDKIYRLMLEMEEAEKKGKK